jgi:hypothetical protein
MSGKAHDSVWTQLSVQNFYLAAPASEEAILSLKCCSLASVALFPARPELPLEGLPSISETELMSSVIPGASLEVSDHSSVGEPVFSTVDYCLRGLLVFHWQFLALLVQISCLGGLFLFWMILVPLQVVSSGCDNGE